MPSDSATAPFHWIGGLHELDSSFDETQARASKQTSGADLDEESINARVAALEQEAFAKGFASGERDGQAAAAKRADAQIARLSATIDEVAALRSGMLHKTERDVVRLAVAMAERILHRALQEEPELLLAMARVAIDRLGDGVAAKIHLHPDDYRAMTAVRSRRPEAVSTAVAIEADPSVSRGGCIVRSEFGVIDLGIDAQMDELSRALLGAESNAA